MARTKHGFFFLKTIDGGPPATDWAYLKGGTAYYEGQICRLSLTSGSAVRAAANCTSVYGVIGHNVASADATTTKAQFYLANTRNIFEAKMIATAAPHSKRFDKLTFNVGSTHNYRASKTAYYGEATACLRVVDHHPDDTSSSTANQRFWLTFLNSASLVGDGSNDA